MFFFVCLFVFFSFNHQGLGTVQVSLLFRFSQGCNPENVSALPSGGLAEVACASKPIQEVGRIRCLAVA